MKIGALIPCRKGSKGISGKNFKDFDGDQLWLRTWDAAVKSGLFDKIILSSDGGFEAPLIMAGNETIVDNNRPDGLSNDSATLDDLLGYYIQKHDDIELWCLLQPTSPLRTDQDIIDARAMLDEKDKKGDPKYDSVISVYQHPVIGWVANSAYHKGRKFHTALYHTNNRPNRQDRKDWYLENGAVYFVYRDTFVLTHSRVGAVPGLYVMPKERSFEIDDMTDWKICEFLSRGCA